MIRPEPMGNAHRLHYPSHQVRPSTGDQAGENLEDYGQLGLEDVVYCRLIIPYKRSEIKVNRG